MRCAAQHCAEETTNAVDDDVHWIEQTLPPEPARGRDIPFVTAAELEELGQIALDRAPIGFGHDEAQEPPHVRPCAS